MYVERQWTYMVCPLPLLCLHTHSPKKKKKILLDPYSLSKSEPKTSTQGDRFVTQGYQSKKVFFVCVCLWNHDLSKCCRLRATSSPLGATR